MDRIRVPLLAGIRRLVMVSLAGGMLLPAALLAQDREGSAEAAAGTFDPVELAPDLESNEGRSREYDLIHLDLDLKIDERAHAAEGTAVNRVRPLRAGLSTLSFDAAGLTVDAVRVDDTPAAFAHEGDQLIVTIDPVRGEGESVAIAIDYRLHDPEKGLYFVGPDDTHPDKPWQVWSQGEDEDNRYWIPTYDYPNDRTTTDLTFTVREPLTAVSNGSLVEVSEGEDGWQRFHWRMDQPYVTYLISVAVGDWERYADDWKGIPVEYYVPRGVGEETARRSFGKTPAMIEFFSDWIDMPYPWPKYAQTAVTDFVVGGMENVSATTQTDRTLHDARAELDTQSTGLVAHELAHQWWGDLLTCRDWSHLWLNEGFATYFEALWTEHEEGPDAFALEMERNARAYRRADGSGEPKPVVVDFLSRRAGGQSHHVYTKGSWILHMLRGILGDDEFQQALRHYARAGRLGLVDTEDLQQAIFDTSGRNLEWFFEQWTRLAGWPEFEVSSHWEEGGGTCRLEVKQVQKRGGLVPLFRMPLDVAITTAEGTTVHRITVSKAEETFSFPAASPPLLVRFDAGNHVLKSVTFEKTTEEWAYQLGHDPDAVGRLVAAEQLGKSEASDLAVAALAVALAGEDHPRIRAAAAASLGTLGGQAARVALLEALDDPASRVRRTAVEALGKVGGEGLGEAVARLLREDPSYETQAAAAGALAALKAPEAEAALLAAIDVPSYRDRVAGAAARALADLGSRQVVPVLLSRLDPPVPDERRRASLDALVVLVDQLRPAERERLEKAVLEALEDPGGRMRLAAISAAGGLSLESAVPLLATMAEKDESRWVRRAAKRGLERLKKALRGEEDSGEEGTGAGGLSRERAEELQRQIDDLRTRLETLERRLGKGLANRGTPGDGRDA